MATIIPIMRLRDSSTEAVCFRYHFAQPSPSYLIRFLHGMGNDCGWSLFWYLGRVWRVTLAGALLFYLLRSNVRTAFH